MLPASFFTVEQRTAAIVQGLGKCMRETGPGIQVKIPLEDRVVGRVNLRVQQLDVEIEAKTEDNVFVRMVVAVQYCVLPEKVHDAFSKLDDARRQLTLLVFDVMRASVLRQAQGYRRIVADQCDSDPTCAGKTRHAQAANAQRHGDGGRPHRRASNAVPATASTAVDESRVMYGPSRESAPSPPANAGRADAAQPTREAHDD